MKFIFNWEHYNIIFFIHHSFTFLITGLSTKCYTARYLSSQEPRLQKINQLSPPTIIHSDKLYLFLGAGLSVRQQTSNLKSHHFPTDFFSSLFPFFTLSFSLTQISEGKTTFTLNLVLQQVFFFILKGSFPLSHCKWLLIEHNYVVCIQYNVVFVVLLLLFFYNMQDLVLYEQIVSEGMLLINPNN